MVYRQHECLNPCFCAQSDNVKNEQNVCKNVKDDLIEAAIFGNTQSNV